MEWRRRVLIVHKLIFEYRLSFYEALGAVDGLDLTVMHSGRPMRREGSHFDEVVVTERQILRGHFLWQPGVLSLAREFDAVIALFDVRYLSNLLLAAMPRRYKLLWWGIGFGRHSWAQGTRLAIAKRSDGVLLYTPRAVSEFAQRGVPRERLFCAPNTVEVGQPSCNTVIRERRNFIFLGSLLARKQLGELLEAFALAIAELPPYVRLDIVGDGPERERLEGLASRLAIQNRVTFHGSIYEESSLAVRFRSALALISPGQVGLSVLHSFAYGVPVVTRRTAISGGETDNITNGENGVFYDQGAPQLAGVMARLAHHPEECVRLGRRGYDHYVGSMRLEHLVGAFLEAIDAVLPGRPTAQPRG